MRLPNDGIRMYDIWYIYKILDNSCNTRINDFFLIFCRKILANKSRVLDIIRRFESFKTLFSKLICFRYHV
jgi:hypothetical protein